MFHLVNNLQYNRKEMSSDLDEDALEEIYSWIDKIPLSRPKKNIARDFSDGGSYICDVFRDLVPFVQI